LSPGADRFGLLPLRSTAVGDGADNHSADRGGHKGHLGRVLLALSAGVARGAICLSRGVAHEGGVWRSSERHRRTWVAGGGVSSTSPKGEAPFLSRPPSSPRRIVTHRVSPPACTPRPYTVRPLRPAISAGWSTSSPLPDASDQSASPVSSTPSRPRPDGCCTGSAPTSCRTESYTKPAATAALPSARLRLDLPG
jgi:hypothetical protein